MPAPEQQVPPADLQKLIEQWVGEHLGLTGTVAFAVLLAILALWWNWEKIQKLPGIAGYLAHRSRRPLPLAPLPRPVRGRFSVAVAHLENDQDGEHERLIVEALSEVRGVQVLKFDRVLAITESNVDDAVKAGHEQARALLAESGADVLIWGTVLRVGEKSLPKLRWTTARKLPVEERPGRYPPTEELNLPELFFNDLTDVLDLLVLTSDQYMSPEEAYTRTSLPEFIARVERLLAAQSAKWPGVTRARLSAAFGDLCLVHGRQDWKNDEWHQKAQLAYRVFLDEHARNPWSLRAYEAALYNFASTHLQRGLCKPDRAQLEQAVPLYRAVAELSLHNGNNWWFAHAKINLGHALRVLGEQEPGTARLEEALGAYEDGAYEVNENRHPDMYRTILFGRAECLRLIGERESGTARLEHAIPPYRALLQLYGPGEADLRKQVEEKLEWTEGEIATRASGSPQVSP